MVAGQFRDVVASNDNKRFESETVLVACVQHVLYRTVKLVALLSVLFSTA